MFGKEATRGDGLGTDHTNSRPEEPSNADPRSSWQTGVDSFVRRSVFVVVLLSLAAVEPALAQNAVCEATGLPQMISGFFQLTTGIGLIGAVVVWQANSLAEMFTLGPDMIHQMKQYKGRALKSALMLVILGPLYSVAGSMMGLPLASCVDLTPL